MSEGMPSLSFTWSSDSRVMRSWIAMFDTAKRPKA